MRGRDGYVVKLSAAGAHVWSTYLGGTGQDGGFAAGIAVDSSGNAYATGGTQSSGWVSGGWNTSYGGNSDGYVVKLSAAGAHVWSTYLGGTDYDYGTGIAVDSSGIAYVTGSTNSSGWVIGGWDTTYNGGLTYGDIYVVKLDTAGAHLWSSYLGGTTDDWGTGIAVDLSGNAYATGWTRSADWVSGGWDTTLDGTDGYVVKIVEGEIVNFPDSNLEARVRSAIGKPTGDIYTTDLVGTSFTSLTANSASIMDLTGLEHCTDLTYLRLDSNQIGDISPVAGLTNLTHLDIRDNQIADLNALVANAGIDMWDEVWLYNNPLIQDALCNDIPTIEGRGVYVFYDGTCAGEGEGEGECAAMTAWIDAEWPLMATDLGLNNNVPKTPGTNIPERWGLASVLAVACNEGHPHHDALVAVYAYNLAELEAESPAILARIAPYKHVLAAILLINQSRRDYFIGLLGLENIYETVHGVQKDLTEPFSDEGDLDGDGITNYHEYKNIVSTGGSYDDYAAYASDPLKEGTVPLAAWPTVLALLAAGAAAMRRGRGAIHRTAAVDARRLSRSNSR